MKAVNLAQMAFVPVAAAAVYLFVGTAKEAETRHVCTPLCAMRPNYANVNRVAPDFELPNLAGKKVRLSDYRGKVVIMNFWTKTCQPCLEEMPSLANLAKGLRKRDDVQFLTLCTDETAEDAKNTLRSVLGTEPPFEVLMDPDAEVVTDKYGTKLFPETWFVDKDGVIRVRVDGTRQWSDALTLDLVDSLSHPVACSVEFSRGQPAGKFASLCEQLSSSG